MSYSRKTNCTVLMGSQLPAKLSRRAPRVASDRAARLRALRETSALVLAGGPLKDILPALAARLARVLKAGCVIRPRRETHSAFALAHGHARAPARGCLGDLVSTHPDALMSAYSARAAQTGTSVFTPAVSSRTLRLWTEPAGWAYLDKFDVCSVLAVPIGGSGEVLGSLVIWREHPGRALTLRDHAFVDQVAHRLSSVFASGSDSGRIGESKQRG